MDYVVFDLETTGFDCKKEKIIEIGAVRVRNGKVTETFSQLVQPGKRLSLEVQNLTGITEEMLADAPYIEEILDAFLKFLGEDVLLGHSLLGDYAFVKRAVVQQYGKAARFDKTGLDTLKLARKYLPELPSKSLPNLCIHYEITHKPHRAVEDALATHQVYQRLLAFYSEGNADFMPKGLHYDVKKESPATKLQKERLAQMLRNCGVEPEYDLERISKNEASREMDRLISQYGIALCRGISSASDALFFL